MLICNKKKCVGCFACKSICPKNAITMKEEENGIFPTIDESKCINCNLCKSTCEKKVQLHNSKNCYSAYSLNKEIHQKSSSGGVAYEICKNIIDHGGIAYGVSSFVDDDGDISFSRISSTKDLYKLQGSKYTHAYVKDAYKNLLKDLNKNIQVIFIGTPCQVAGLKKYLRKDYENLITIDIVCHGVMPQHLLKSEINRDFDYINFRGENGFTLIAKSKGRTVYKKNKYESDYYDLFLNGYGYRENCYTCKYAQKKRIGDLTIGDFWGKADYKQKGGISLILINTVNGEKILKSSLNLKIENEEIEKAYKQNAQLVHPTYKKEDNDLLLENIKIYGLKQAKKRKNYKTYYKIKIKGFLKKIKDMV